MAATELGPQYAFRRLEEAAMVHQWKRRCRCWRYVVVGLEDAIVEDVMNTGASR